MTFSIITPTLNQSDWLGNCVASVREQAGVNDKIQNPNPKGHSQTLEVQVEHIIQDGGSEDWDEFKGKALKQWPDSENYRLRLFSERDSGMYDAVNRGLLRAQGDILGYLNSDEQYTEGALEKVATFFEENPAVDILFGDFIIADAECEPLSYRRVVVPHALYTRLWHLNTSTCSMFFRRRIVDEGFLFNPSWKMIGDAEWVWRLSLAGKRMASLKQALAVHIHTGRNLSGTKAFLLEFAKWRQGTTKLERACAPLLQVIYMGRKFLAGAYRRHEIRLNPYSRGPGIERRPSRFYRLDWRWAKNWMKKDGK